MPEILHDKEFGDVRIKRFANARYVRIRMGADGRLSATLPTRGSLRALAQLLRDSRDELQKMMRRKPSYHPITYHEGDRIGQSHSLKIVAAEIDDPQSVIRSGVITIKHPTKYDAHDEAVQQAIATAVRKVLRAEAHAYLPKRLAELAEQHSVTYESVSFGNAKGRWGSCSNSGAIRLNIALMKLPPSLIDYVLIHELSHTEEMNHSQRFWQLVNQRCDSVNRRRAQLRRFSPYL